MENFLVIQGDIEKLGDVGREQISKKHKSLRSEVLDDIVLLQEQINGYLRESSALCKKDTKK